MKSAEEIRKSNSHLASAIGKTSVAATIAVTIPIIADVLEALNLNEQQAKAANDVLLAYAAASADKAE